MRKKILIMTIALLSTVGAMAQFEEGKAYIGASLSGLNLSYNGSDKAKFGLQAEGGYMFADDWMVKGHLAYNKQENVPSTLSLGAGARYYIVQNGLYLGADVDYVHARSNYDDVMPSLHLGYAFFLNGSVTIEPEIYYNQSLKNHSDYSTIGFRIGLGVYL